jgi:hypothetical protein
MIRGTSSAEPFAVSVSCFFSGFSLCLRLVRQYRTL